VFGIDGAKKGRNRWSFGDVLQAGQQVKKSDGYGRIYKILTTKEDADTNEHSICCV